MLQGESREVFKEIQVTDRSHSPQRLRTTTPAVSDYFYLNECTAAERQYVLCVFVCVSVFLRHLRDNIPGCVISGVRAKVLR